MVEANKGLFEIIKDDKKAFVINEFEDKFVEYLTKYEYIVGDYSNNILRLKGFDKSSVDWMIATGFLLNQTQWDT